MKPVELGNTWISTDFVQTLPGQCFGFVRDQPQNQVPQRLDTCEAKLFFLGLPNIISKIGVCRCV